MNRILSYIYKFIAIIPIVLINSCSNNSAEPESFNTIISPIPIIPGIFHTDSDANELGRWRNPVHQPEIRYKPTSFDTLVGPNSLSIQVPFPNPSFDKFSIYFRLPVATNITLWAEKGRLPEESEGKPELLAGGKFVSRTINNGKIVLIEESLKLAGNYAYYWNALSAGISPGFYRIYLKADGHILFRDVMFARDIDDLPAGIRERYDQQ